MKFQFYLFTVSPPLQGPPSPTYTTPLSMCMFNLELIYSFVRVYECLIATSEIVSYTIGLVNHFRQHSTNSINHFRQHSTNSINHFRQHSTHGINHFRQQSTNSFNHFRQHSTNSINQFRQHSTNGINHFNILVKLLLQ